MHASLARAGRKRRRGLVVILLAILLPVVCGMIALVVDVGLLMKSKRAAQQAADAAATMAAKEKQAGASDADAVAAAIQCVQEQNDLADAEVDVFIPPQTGVFAGSSRHVEVVVRRSIALRFFRVVSGESERSVTVRAVAGFEPSTAGAAIMVLDPDPPPFEVAPVPLLLPPLPAIVGGLEVLGAGTVSVDGSVLVNTQWGGVDEHGQPAGDGPGPPYAISCTPLLPLTKLRARDIRVVGGVDDPANYGNFTSGQTSPLRANRLSVPDPLRDLPAPTLAVDPTNVKSTNYGGKTIVALPLLSPPTVLKPGVYEWIDVTAGQVVFEPGVYIIRNKEPLTQISLSVAAGQVQAEGVMFYITDNAAYSPSSGSPDASDGETQPSPPGLGALVPCAVINFGLLSSTFSPLSDPDSPFDGMLIYQRRHDRRPILLVQQDLIGGGQLRGTIYAKWGHVIVSGKGTYDARFIAGTMRFISLLNCDVRPTVLLAPAEDVFLVE